MVMICTPPNMRSMSHHLLDLPHEVLHRILANVDPQDLGRVCCCRALNGFIKENRLLWRELYIKNFVSNFSQEISVL